MKIAVIGATGMVGNVMLEVLLERQLKFDELLLVASEKNIGKEVIWNDEVLKVVGLSYALEQKPEIAIFSAMSFSTTVTKSALY
mgnify:CR=1 FL=1